MLEGKEVKHEYICGKHMWKQGIKLKEKHISKGLELFFTPLPEFPSSELH